MENDDPFVRAYDAEELEIAAEFLGNWLPFLSRGLCSACAATLGRRIQSLRATPPLPNCSQPDLTDSSLGLWPDVEPHQEGCPKGTRLSWADMAQEDELEEEEEEEERKAEAVEEEEMVVVEEKKASRVATGLSRKQREYIRFKNVGRKKDFVCLERVRGRLLNIAEGLELHTGVFSAVEQKRIVDYVYDLQEKGRNLQLEERTYSEPRKWMQGKGRVTIQFGCCYNYATDKNGNPSGILRDVKSDPIPQLFKVIIKRLVGWHVIPTSCVPDSCIVNIYEPGDCIPPHIDSHDFVRPFCTVSFLSECNILFGSQLKIAGPGKFSGSFAIPLPVGSVLVLNGNGADIAKHCVPAVPTKRISITFRKMDESKLPFKFTPEADLQNIRPLSYDSDTMELPNLHINQIPVVGIQSQKKSKESTRKPIRSELESESEDSQPLRKDPESHARTSPHQIVSQPPVSSSSSYIQRGRRYSERLPEIRPTRRVRPDQDVSNELNARSPQQLQADEGSHSWNDIRGSTAGRWRPEQKEIVRSHSLEDREELHARTTRPFARARSPRISIRTLGNGRRWVGLSET